MKGFELKERAGDMDLTTARRIVADEDNMADNEQWTQDELFLATCLAFVSAERHKIPQPDSYASAFAPSFVSEAKRVLTALNTNRK